MAKLTEKQKLFVKEYLKDLNATQAAIRAKYSEKTARKIGQENLTKPDIRKQIQAAIKKRSERIEFDGDKNLLDIEMLKQECWLEKNYSSALKACELIGRHLGQFNDSLEIKKPNPHQKSADEIASMTREQRKAYRKLMEKRIASRKN